MTYMRRLLVLSLVLAAAFAFASVSAAGASSSKPSKKDVASATAFIRKIAEYKASGQAGRAYDYLVPAQKAVVAKTAYIACQPNGGANIDSFELQAAHAETVQIPGTNANAKTIALTIKVTVSKGNLKKTSTITTHAIRTKKGWAWGMPQTDIDKCGTPAVNT